MRHLRTLVILIVVLSVGIGVASAESKAVTSSLSYVWIRSAPSSYAGVVYTVYPTGYATLETTGNTQWDGYQTWAEVYVIANSAIRGWVEQGSLVSASQASASVPQWGVNIPVPANNGVAFNANWNAQAAQPQNQQPVPQNQPQGQPAQSWGNNGWQPRPQ